MAGANCAFPQCTVSRTAKYKGIGIFQIPMRQDDFHKNWRKEIVNVVSRFRVMDKTLKERVLNGKVYVCERHFIDTDIEFTSKLLI